MRHETVTIPKPTGFDWKAAGYLTSILSVLLLGAVAWQKPDAPGWYHPALIAGMASSIRGMAFRYLAHLHQKREIARAERDSRSR